MSLFRKSVDDDSDTKQLIVEELAHLQCQYHFKECGADSRAFMGFPWMVNLVTIWLRERGLKASDLTISSVVHVGDLLAREMIAQRKANFAADDQSDAPVTQDELMIFFMCGKALEQLGTMIEAGVTTRRRAFLFATMGQITHQMQRIGRKAKRLNVTDVQLEEVERSITPAAMEHGVQSLCEAAQDALRNRNPAFML